MFDVLLKDGYNCDWHLGEGSPAMEPGSHTGSYRLLQTKLSWKDADAEERYLFSPPTFLANAKQVGRPKHK